MCDFFKGMLGSSLPIIVWIELNMGSMSRELVVSVACRIWIESGRYGWVGAYRWKL